jgi:type VI secretion system protein ImpK
MMRADHLMLAQQADEHYLGAQLLAFHAELVHTKQRLLAPADGGAAGQPRPADVGHALGGFLQAQDVALLGHGGRYALENQAEARYLKVALADESLIGLEQWEYHDAWLSELLEMRLFGSRCAGERVFSAIDALLREDIPARREMATLYLLALAMGFQGRYRGSEAGAQRLRQLRSQLYAYASGAQAVPALGDERIAADPDLRRRMLPQAYDYTVTDAAPRMLPDPRRWIRAFAAAAVVLLALAYWIWHARTDKLADYFTNDGVALSPQATTHATHAFPAKTR